MILGKFWYWLFWSKNNLSFIMGCAVDVTGPEGLQWSILADFEPLLGVTVYS